MAARKFGPEEHDRDSGDYMARIQELQEQLNRLRRQSSAADGNGAAAGLPISTVQPWRAPTVAHVPGSLWRTSTGHQLRLVEEVAC